MKKRPFKRFLIGADLHCSHRVGLTPPRFQSQIKGKKYYKIQNECYDWYAKELETLKPIDIYCLNGDLIDGDGGRSGGTELITTDIREQREMAGACISLSS